MTGLQFDVQAAKEQLAQLLRGRVAAEGFVLQTETLFAATKVAQTWSNDVRPSLTAIPQAIINYASRHEAVLPLVLAELRAAAPDRAKLQVLFAGLAASIEQQVASVSAVAASLKSLETGIAAHTAFSSAGTAVGALSSTVARIIDGWNQHASVVAEVITQLSGDRPVAEILSQFDLERTRSKWDELNTFATRWQTVESDRSTSCTPLPDPSIHVH
jgi:hypothetical protein